MHGFENLKYGYLGHQKDTVFQAEKNETQIYYSKPTKPSKEMKNMHGFDYQQHGKKNYLGIGVLKIKRYCLLHEKLQTNQTAIWLLTQDCY
jgi:hypothetical protein